MRARPSDDWLFLDDDDVEHLLPFGTVRETRAGETLFAAGDSTPSFFVVLVGTVDLLSAGPEGAEVITTHVARQFLGEFNLLLELRPVVSAVVRDPGSVLEIDQPAFNNIMRTMPDIADLVFLQFDARRRYSKLSQTVTSAI
jgi:thioredoxin reductase (NADPH)